MQSLQLDTAQMVVRTISRFATRGEKVGASMATFDWDHEAPAPKEMRVSSGGLDLTPSSIHLQVQVHLQVHLQLHQVVPTTLPVGRIKRTRHVAILKAIIGAHPADVKAMAGGVLGEESPTFTTAMATLLWMHAALVVVVPTGSLCE